MGLENRPSAIAKRLVTGSVVLLTTIATCADSHALEPPLKDRTFFKGTRFSTGKQPWIDVRSLDLGNQDHAKDLREWLVAREDALATWPPKYRDETHITRLIEEWQKKRSSVAKNESPLLATPENGAVVATFWLYGHHLDEPGAAESLYSALDQLQKKFPDSPLPPLLRGMALNDTGGKNVAAHLAEAKKKTTDKQLQGMADLTLAARCMVTQRRHRAVIAFTNAVEECETCLRGYEYMMHYVPTLVVRSPGVAEKQPYAMARAKDALVVGSNLFGFYMQLPLSWDEPNVSPYDPSKPFSVVSLSAPPLPDSGLIHGLTVFSAVQPAQADANAVPEIVKRLANKDSVESFTTIEPLVRNKYLRKWYRIDTRHGVGKDDHITEIVASGLVVPVRWTRQEHLELADQEPPCEPGFLEKQEPGKITFWRVSGSVRLDAPIEITVIYHGSRNSYKQAAERFKKIVSTFQVNERAGSEFFGYQ